MQRRELMLAGALAALPVMARAQGADYPKAGATLRYIVPFPPGGLTDARSSLAMDLAAELDVEVATGRARAGRWPT